MMRLADAEILIAPLITHHRRIAGEVRPSEAIWHTPRFEGGMRDTLQAYWAEVGGLGECSTSKDLRRCADVEAHYPLSRWPWSSDCSSEQPLCASLPPTRFRPPRLPPLFLRRAPRAAPSGSPTRSPIRLQEKPWWRHLLTTDEGLEFSLVLHLRQVSSEMGPLQSGRTSAQAPISQRRWRSMPRPAPGNASPASTGHSTS